MTQLVIILEFHVDAIELIKTILNWCGFFFGLVWTHYAHYYSIPSFCFVLFVLLNIRTLLQKSKECYDENLNHLHAITWPDISLGNTLKFLGHKDDGNFSGSGKRISITMTIAWRCTPCRRMRRIQKTQWSGSGHAIYSRKSSLDAGGLAEESGGLCWCVAWPLRGRSCGRYASTRESDGILSLQTKYLPSFRERYSPPDPESASIGRSLGWCNFNIGVAKGYGMYE